MRQERAVRTRARVLDAAAAEFAAHGYKGATLLGVVQRTGMTKGALYGHFASKEALAATLIEEAGDAVAARAARHAGRAATAPHALREVTLDLARHLRQDVRTRSALRVAMEVPELDRDGRGPVERIRVLLTGAVAAAQADRQALARQPPDTVARLLMSVFLGVPHPVPRSEADAARRFDDLWEAVSGSPPDGVPAAERKAAR